MPGIASSAPAVLIAHLATATTTLRVGSGGVMLPNHSPLVIAEQFGTLEALHPGRIDLGIGRAPGTDQITAYALRRSMTGGRRSAPAAASCAATSTATFQRVHAMPGEGDSRRSGCSARSASAPSWPASWGCRSASPTTSCPRTRSPRWTSTARSSSPRPALRSRTR